jgi:hypothetical protein
MQNRKIRMYRTINFPVVLCGWLTLREKRRLRVFETRVLRAIFGPNKDKVSGEWRKLHNEHLNNIKDPTNITGFKGFHFEIDTEQ